MYQLWPRLMQELVQACVQPGYRSAALYMAPPKQVRISENCEDCVMELPLSAAGTPKLRLSNVGPVPARRVSSCSELFSVNMKMCRDFRVNLDF